LSRKNPECFGTFEEDDEACTEEREVSAECKRKTGYLEWKAKGGKKQSKTYGLSRARAMKAMCFECNGGTNRGEDCNAPACPLYAWMTKAEKDPIPWFMKKTSEWNEAAQRARGAKIIVGESEEDEDEDE